MPVERLTGPDDPRVVDYRDIAEPELVRSRGLFVAEGRLVVKRLLAERRYALRSILVSDAAYQGLGSLIETVGAQVPIYICPTREFSSITGYNVHRGCLAIAERPQPTSARDLLTIASLKAQATLVILENVTNADNVGGVFRNAAAFEADGILLGPTCCDPLYRKAIRTSMAATLRLPFARINAWPDGLAAVVGSGFTIVALTPREPALALESFAQTERPPRIAIMVGTEGDGLTPAAEAAADIRVRIPIAPETDSLNLAVAVGIALYRLAG
jgi:tRNA G18 (ribose-2'-O)-methylase SpoU